MSKAVQDVAAGDAEDGLMVWKRLEVGGQLGICCQRVQLTALERGRERQLSVGTVEKEKAVERRCCLKQGRWREH